MRKIKIEFTIYMDHKDYQKVLKKIMRKLKGESINESYLITTDDFGYKHNTHSIIVYF